jgi:hypothetical protein
MDGEVRALALAVTYPDRSLEREPAALKAEIHALLTTAAAGEDMSGPVREILMAHPYLNEWVQQVLEDPLHRPPHLQPSLRRSSGGPPGLPIAPADRFRCDVHDFTWFRSSVTETVPNCPYGGESLKPAD